VKKKYGVGAEPQRNRGKGEGNSRGRPVGFVAAHIKATKAKEGGEEEREKQWDDESAGKRATADGEQSGERGGTTSFWIHHAQSKG